MLGRMGGLTVAENRLVDGEYEIWRNSQWRVTNQFLEEVADPALADHSTGFLAMVVCGATATILREMGR